MSKLRLKIEFNKDSDFIKNNFEVFTSANIKNSVAAGYPVIVKFSNSYITVFGIQYDGEAYLLDEDLFENCEKIVVRIL